MSGSKVLDSSSIVSLAFSVVACSAALEKPYSHEAWAESQHPPSDTAPLPAGCKPVQYKGGSIPIRQAVDGAGKHCVIHDFVQRKKIDLHDRSTQGSPGFNGVLSFFESSNIDLDLRGHLISGAPFKDTVGVKVNTGNTDQIRLNLRVHNGRLENPGVQSVSVFMTPFKGAYNGYLQEEDSAVPKRATGLDKNAKVIYVPWNYQPPTHYIAENLTIRSGGRGIVMAGADNVVRNNVIEVDGKTAVYMYGPRPVIEGNTFILNMSDDDKAPLSAALKLRDAGGAIIRNNRFIVQSGPFGGKAEAAINLLESKDVLIENNTVQDTRQLVRKDSSSTAVERSNQLK